MTEPEETQRRWGWMPAERATGIVHQYEERVVSSTGGEKGKKPAALGDIDPASLLALAEVAGYGRAKYSHLNYVRGYDWSLSFDALQRHALAFWNGEDVDPESGLPHMAHAAWHCLTLLTFVARDRGTDDRITRFLESLETPKNEVPDHRELGLPGPAVPAPDHEDRSGR